MGDVSNTFFGNMVPVKVRNGALVVDTTGADGTGGGGGGGGGGAITVADGADVAQGDRDDAVAGSTLSDPLTLISLTKAVVSVLRGTLVVDDPDLDTAMATLNATMGATSDAVATGDVNGTMSARLRYIAKFIAAGFSFVTNSLAVTLATGLDKMNDEVAAVLPQVTVVEGNLASTTAASVIAAPSAGNHLEIYRIEVQATADGANNVTWREGSGGSDKYQSRLLTDGTIISRRLSGSWHVATATAFYIKASTTVGLHYLVEYRTVSDAARA